jgi:hypothetical protein
MNFDFDEEQRALADTVQRFIGKDYTFETRRTIRDSAPGWSREVWQALGRPRCAGRQHRRGPRRTRLRPAGNRTGDGCRRQGPAAGTLPRRRGGRPGADSPYRRRRLSGAMAAEHRHRRIHRRARAWRRPQRTGNGTQRQPQRAQGGSGPRRLRRPAARFRANGARRHGTVRRDLGRRGRQPARLPDARRPARRGCRADQCASHADRCRRRPRCDAGRH